MSDEKKSGFFGMGKKHETEAPKPAPVKTTYPYGTQADAPKPMLKPEDKPSHAPPPRIEAKADLIEDLAQYADEFSLPPHEAKATLLDMAKRAKAKLKK